MQNSLAERLKEMLEEDKAREAARRIEDASFKLLGDHHIAYGPEAMKLAQVDLEKFEQFVDKLIDIRMTLDEQYAKAAKKLGEDNG